MIPNLCNRSNLPNQAQSPNNWKWRYNLKQQILSLYGLNHEWLDAMNAQDSSVLNQIDIGDCDIDCQKIRKFLTFFWGKLSKLSLQRNLIRADGIKSIMNCGDNFINLCFLNLQFNKIGSRGAKYLSKTNFPQLKQIKLGRQQNKDRWMLNRQRRLQRNNQSKLEQDIEPKHKQQDIIIKVSNYIGYESMTPFFSNTGWRIKKLIIWSNNNDYISLLNRRCMIKKHRGSQVEAEMEMEMEMGMGMGMEIQNYMFNEFFKQNV